ncbi:MAG: hypothetical protein ACP5VS_02570 [Desulfomonilaceae bacterium]
MKRLLFLTIAIFLVNAAANAELLEMSASCDQAITKLKEIISYPDSSTAEKIRDAFGVDIFNTCDSADGKIICFQCLDKNLKLNLIQLQENLANKSFELKGLGCKCDKKK